MAAIAWKDVTDFASALTEVDPAVQMLVLARVNGGGINPRVFGGEGSATLRIARIFLAAHIGTLQLEATKNGGLQGPLTSETVAADSVSFAYGNWASATTQDGLQLTVWGAQFAGLAPGASLPYVAGCRYWGG